MSEFMPGYCEPREYDFWEQSRVHADQIALETDYILMTQTAGDLPGDVFVIQYLAKVISVHGLPHDAHGLEMQIKSADGIRSVSLTGTMFDGYVNLFQNGHRATANQRSTKLAFFRPMRDVSEELQDLTSPKTS